MPYNVKVDDPRRGNQSVYIHGLGTFENGTETEVSDEQVMRYRAMNARQVFGEQDPETGRYPVTMELAPEPHEVEGLIGVTITRLDGTEVGYELTTPPQEGGTITAEQDDAPDQTGENVQQVVGTPSPEGELPPDLEEQMKVDEEEEGGDVQ